MKRSRSREGKGSLDSKRGVFTSRHFIEESKPNAKVYLENSLGNSIGVGLQNSLRNSFEGSK